MATETGTTQTPHSGLTIAGTSPEEFDQDTLRLILEKIQGRREHRLKEERNGGY